MVLGYITVGVVLGLVIGYALNELVKKLGRRSQESRLSEYNDAIEDLEAETARLRDEVRRLRQDKRVLKNNVKKEVKS